MLRKNIAISAFFLLIFSVGSAGCANLSYLKRGGDFDVFKLTQLTLLKSTKSDFLRQYGEPFQREKVEKEGKIHEVFYYQFGELLSGRMNFRTLAVEFKDNTWNGFTFQSSYPQDSSYFDEKKRKLLVEGKTTKGTAKNILGNPTGIILVPSALNYSVEKESDFELALKRVHEIWSYWYMVYPKADLSSIREKRLFLYFNDQGILVEKQFKTNIAE